jgi:hypothetical protein
MERAFKFSEIVTAGDERVQYLPAFARVISKHSICNIVFVVRGTDVRRAMMRVKAPGILIDWGPYNNPYLFVFLQFLHHFHNRRYIFEPLIDREVPIDLIFDDQMEKGLIISSWDQIVAAQPPQTKRNQYSSLSPRFESDQKFLPLQAADFVAGWARYCIERAMPPAKGKMIIGGRQVANPIIPFVRMDMTEDDIVGFMVRIISANLPDWRYTCDIQVSFSSNI